MKDWSEANGQHGMKMLRALEALRCQPHSVHENQYVALCPFHNDHRPSLSLNVKYGIFNCFACHHHGTIFDFMEALHAVGYPVSEHRLEKKADRQRIKRAMHRTGNLPPYSTDLTAVEACVAFCVDHWSECLLRDPTKTLLVAERYATTFMRPIRDGRGQAMGEKECSYISPEFSSETIRKYKIGFAPPSAVELRKQLDAQFPEEVLLGTGLFRKHGTALHCVMNGRVVYPYLIGGKPLYTIGRLTEYTPKNYAIHKYYKQHLRVGNRFSLPLQNPPLFNMDAIEESSVILITEGITDALKAVEIGIPAASPASVSFKKDALEWMVQKMANKTVVLCNDAEPNGAGAAGIALMEAELKKRDIQPRSVQLPRRDDQTKVDVCSYIREEGREAFFALIESQTGIVLPR